MQSHSELEADTVDVEPESIKTELDWHARPMGDLYGLAQLETDRLRQLVSLASLPRWNGDDLQWRYGHGIGPRLDRILGGGVCPGYVLGIGAGTAKAGKTACATQIGDGLALRCVEVLKDNTPGPLTPVLMLSEMSAAALSWRALARWTGFDSNIFRAGASAITLEHAPDWHSTVEGAWRAGREALTLPSPFADARARFLRMLRIDRTTEGRIALQGESGAELIRAVSGMLLDWRARLEGEHDREVWPVLIVDPVQRWQGHDDGEVDALNEVAETLREEADAHGWIVIVTSDTNATSGRGQGGKTRKEEDRPPDVDRAALAFRGSYKLIHILDAAITLTRPDDASDTMAITGEGKRHVDAVVWINRWGAAGPATVTEEDARRGRTAWPRFLWHPATGRFGALSDLQSRGGGDRSMLGDD